MSLLWIFLIVKEHIYKILGKYRTKLPVVPLYIVMFKYIK